MPAAAAVSGTYAEHVGGTAILHVGGSHGRCAVTGNAIGRAIAEFAQVRVEGALGRPWWATSSTGKNIAAVACSATPRPNEPS